MTQLPDPQGFIRTHTEILPVAHVPEIRLHQASEVTPLWQMTEEELGAIGVPPPFWAFAWAGGQGLARYIMDHKDEVDGRRVFDFATGSGLVAIAAKLAGAQEVIANDIDPFCGAAVALNAKANGVSVRFLEGDQLSSPPPEVDLILAGDVCYEKPMTERVLAWLQAARDRGIRVLIGDPGRTYFPREGLIPRGDYQVPTTRELEDYEIKRVRVWEMP